MKTGLWGWIERHFQSKPRRVLFVGNSLTYLEAPGPGERLVLHDLPGLMARLAHSRGERALAAGRITENGASLEDQRDGGRLDRELRPGAWDYVVLQENSERAVSDEVGMRRDLVRIDAWIKRCGARTAIFSAWAAKNPTSRVHGELAAQTGALLVPVAEAWRAAAAARPELVLCMKDGVHAGPLGSYLSACTFFAGLYGKSPETSDPSVIADDAQAVEALMRAQERAGAGEPSGPVSAGGLEFIRALAWSVVTGDNVGVKPAIGGGDSRPSKGPGPY